MLLNPSEPQLRCEHFTHEIERMIVPASPEGGGKPRRSPAVPTKALRLAPVGQGPSICVVSQVNRGQGRWAQCPPHFSCFPITFWGA